MLWLCALNFSIDVALNGNFFRSTRNRGRRRSYCVFRWRTGSNAKLYCSWRNTTRSNNVINDVGRWAAFKLIMELFLHIQVSWLRDTMPIDQHNEQYTMENRGTRHTLVIRRVKSQDFGNYSCVADNQLGKNKKIITLSGLPRAPQIRSNAQSQWRDKYNISWTVDSYAPIEEYKLYYKMLSHNSVGFQNHLDTSMDVHANYVR